VRELKVERASISSAGSVGSLMNVGSRVVSLLSCALAMLLVVPWGSRVVVAAIAANPLRRVLVVYSDERLLPANVIVDEAIRSTFATETTNCIEFYSEFLDVTRFPGEAQQERERDFLRDRYRERPPDLVIAGGGPALDFLLKYRGDLSPNREVLRA
jgi:hypothetical protein